MSVAGVYMRTITAVALAVILSAGSPAQASTAERSCGFFRLQQDRHEFWSFGPNGRLATCKYARQVLRTYLRDGRSRARVMGWRCDNGGSNGAVLMQCNNRQRLIVVYDATYGE